MSAPIIRVDGVGKRYRLGELGATTIAQDLQRILARLRGRPDPLAPVEPAALGMGGNHEFWPLRNVCFSVREGEVLGLIGRNGAGKSTLLKILSRITSPTTGEVRMRGRVASLLEVGTGFHPDLSGRDNIFLNGAILGMTRHEIRRRLDEIIDFAEIERFIDTPVKRYSSGMYVRLAFSVAAHLDAEILLVDEVLAVGDAAFQRKCLGRMEGAAASGRTVILVSHNMVAVRSLCTRAVWLADGRAAAVGEASEVVDAYLRDTLGCESATQETWPGGANAPGDGRVRLTRVSVQRGSAAPDILTMDSPFQIHVEFQVLESSSKLHVTLALLLDDTIAFTTSSAGKAGELAEGVHVAVCHMPGCLLNEGRYGLRVLLVRDGSRVVVSYDSRVSIQIVDSRRRPEGWLGREPGVVAPALEWTLGPVP